MNSNFPEGLYDLIHTRELKEKIDSLKLTDNAQWRSLSKEEIYLRLKEEFAHFFAQRFSDLFESKKPEKWESKLISFCTNFHSEVNEHKSIQVSEAKALDCILSNSELNLGLQKIKPDTPLANSALLTGSSRSPSLHSQLKKELQSCDRADWIVSFIKWSGLRPILETIKEFCAKAHPSGMPKLRIATTSYMGATDPKAIEELLKISNCEVRISYDTKRTRLHAKAYIFHRKTGFGSAYIGSANVSKAALDEGLEWTAKISQKELEYLWKQVIASFESHWEDPTEFSPCTLDGISDLRTAIKAEKHQDLPQNEICFYDLRPYDYQKVVLDEIQAERDIGKTKHLVIAATGTGKTMIAAFDYRNFAQKTKSLPNLLFIAHREEILKQALNSYRQVLRNGSFGELLTGRHKPSQDRHLFCTVQSWNSQNLDCLDSKHFDYVVLDEAHHARADTYQKLIKHIQTKSLLGLTATPERQDGKDIRDDFEGQFTHEIRLPEAIERSLLCPFHYYGVSDAPGIDLSRLTWKSGRYVGKELEEILSYNIDRASWVLSQCQEYLNDWSSVRGLGFCINVAHAKFMAEYFTKRGVKSLILSAESEYELRQSAKIKLISGEVKFIFTVDLFNEGVDIPEVNTVLFLRPTESLTVFLQQLGRGLRIHSDKAQLVILDFIAAQNKEFSFARRFQALTSRPELRIDDQIEKDMPYLPSSCMIHLEKQAKDYVLKNIREATNRLKGKRFYNELKELQSQLGKRPILDDILNRFLIDDPDEVYKKGVPSQLLEVAEGKEPYLKDNLHKKLAKGLRNLALMDDHFLLSGFQRLLESSSYDKITSSLLHAVLWGQKKEVNSLTEAEKFVKDHPGLKRDLIELFQWKQNKLHYLKKQNFNEWTQILNLHASYTREQVLLTLGMGSFKKPFPSREGVLHIPNKKLDIFFVDINKSEEDFSPTTMYEDYAITDKLFHWQSQNSTRPDSGVGNRYIMHEEKHYTPLLFIRDKNKLSNGLTAPYIFLGPVKYKSHEGSKPISFVWEMVYPIPAKVLNWARRIG